MKINNRTIAVLALMAVIAVLAVVPCCALSGCSLFNVSGQTAAPSSPVRAQMRAAVLLAKDTWVVAGNACIASQTLPGGMPKACETDMIPAHDAIVAAAYAVDAMDVAATSPPPEAVCFLTNAAAKMAALVPSLGKAGDNLKGLAEDAVVLAHGLGVCLPESDVPVPNYTDPNPYDGTDGGVE